MSYLLVVILLGLLILAHELGHFLAARFVGIPVSRFSVGFGPKLCGLKHNGTDYWLSAIPLGGYVLPAVEDEHEYLRIPVARRIGFLLGGPLANLLLPVLLFAVLSAISGNASPGGILVAPFVRTAGALVRLLSLIPHAFTQTDAVTGVLGLVIEGAGFAGTDLAKVLQFAIMISLNLAVLNMLPIPVLDGGKILLHLLEKVHPKATSFYVPLSVLGIMLVLGLLVYTTALDIGRYVL